MDWAGDGFQPLQIVRSLDVICHSKTYSTQTRLQSMVSDMTLDLHAPRIDRTP